MAALRGGCRRLMTRFLLTLLALLLSGCAGHPRKAATEGDESADAKACTSIRSALGARDRGVLSVLTIFCGNQLVVIAGALAPDYKRAVEASTRHQDTSHNVWIASRLRPLRRRATRRRDENQAALNPRREHPCRHRSDGGRGHGSAVGMVDDQAKADRIVASAAWSKAEASGPSSSSGGSRPG
jgi:hypothetical protein